MLIEISPILRAEMTMIERICIFKSTAASRHGVLASRVKRRHFRLRKRRMADGFANLGIASNHEARGQSWRHHLSRVAEMIPGQATSGAHVGDIDATCAAGDG